MIGSRSTEWPGRKSAALQWFSPTALLAAPAICFLLLFFGGPLLEVVLRSLTDPSPENYLIFSYTAYQKVLLTTFRTALLVTVACVFLGYPYAFVLTHAPHWLSLVLTAVVLFPFWSSLLVRTYAWIVLLQDTGVINTLLLRFGIISERLHMIRTPFGVFIGMTYVLLPFMVLPLCSVMRRIDSELVVAAGGLGARPFMAFLRIFLPLSLPGVYAGSLLVFTLSLGYYITPALLGSPREAMMGELIVNNVQGSLMQFGVGSAIAVVLLMLTLLVLWIGTRVVPSETFRVD